MKMDDAQRLELIAEAVRYCQRVAATGMPSCCYSKALREPVHFLWERRRGSKLQAARFCSRAAVGLSFGGRQLVYDHAIPFRYLEAELLRLPTVDTEKLRNILDRLGTAVLITKLEDDTLNRAGYGNKMPRDWDQKDPLARYKAAGIEIVENPRSR